MLPIWLNAHYDMRYCILRHFDWKRFIGSYGEPESWGMWCLTYKIKLMWSTLSLSLSMGCRIINVWQHQYPDAVFLIKNSWCDLHFWLPFRFTDWQHNICAQSIGLIPRNRNIRCYVWSYLKLNCVECIGPPTGLKLLTISIRGCK